METNTIYFAPAFTNNYFDIENYTEPIQTSPGFPIGYHTQIIKDKSQE
jgi:hypothetical protein